MQEVARDQSVMTGTPTSTQTSLPLFTCLFSVHDMDTLHEHFAANQTCDPANSLTL